MAVSSAKHQADKIVTLNLDFRGGLNYATPPANLPDNECQRVKNAIFDAASGKLVSRPGTVCVTAAGYKFGTSILAIYYYEKSASEKWLVGVNNGKLYYLSGTTWVEIGSLNDATTTPSFVTFNSKLLIADGGSDIKTWDGTTFTTISGSPQGTVMTTIGTRVVINSATDKDMIYFSAPADAESADAWDTTKTAVGIRCGYGDNMSVNGFGVFQTDLIVSKKGDSEKRTYRIDTSNATTTNWTVEVISKSNCAQNAQSIISAFNDVFFVDTNGFRSVRGVQEYGDLNVEHVGSKIAPIFNGSSTTACSCIRYLPLYSAIWFCLYSRVFAYHRLKDENGDVRYAFTELVFQQGQITCVVQADTTVYIACADGYLYKMSDTVSTDATSASTTANFVTKVTTKEFNFFADGILKRTEWYLSPKGEGVGYIYAVIGSTEKLLKTLTLTSEADELYDATGKLYVATEDLYDAGNLPWYETTWNRVRGGRMAFTITATSGRFAINALKAEFAQAGV